MTPPPSRRALRRAAALLALLIAEGLALGLAFDSATLAGLGPGWWSPLARTVGAVMPAAAAVGAALLLVAWARDISRDVAAVIAPARAALYLLIHLGCFGLCFAASALLFRERGVPPAHAGRLVAAWLATAGATFVTWAAALAPPRRLLAMARAQAPVLAGGLALGAVAFAVGRLAQGLWLPLRRATFAAASAGLGLFVDHAVTDVPTLSFGTDAFMVEIAPACSGYEGIGLTVAFVAASLWLFRDRLRFPRAFVLLPLAMVLPWLANAGRLVALVLVGTFLSPDLAAGGFHSYAGSLLFCAVALGLVAGALRWRWLVRPPARAAHDEALPAGAPRNPAAPYLVPFLATVAAGLVSRAFSSGGSEPLWFLRPLAGLVALLVFRRHPGAQAPWRPSWFAAPAGLLVAAAWMALDRLASPALGGAVAAPGPGGALWARVAGTIVIVPVVEELAFRGFLARRLSAARFESLPPAHMTLGAIAISSLAFGLLHQRPAAGIAAGVAYALVYRRRGRLGDAIVAHAATNAALLLAAWWLGAWGLWL